MIKVPDADFVLSMTCVAGAINGSFAPLNHGGRWDSKTRSTVFNPWSKFITAYKFCIWGQNFAKSQNGLLENVSAEVDSTSPELVKHKFKSKSRVLKLSLQYSNILYDQNVESWGWNRGHSESRLGHLLRLLRSDYYESTKDHAMPDLAPCGTIRLSESY
jgi:hypothetical protein